MRRILKIDGKRAWELLLSEYAHVNLTPLVSRDRASEAHSEDVLIIHTGDGVEDDRNTLMNMPSNARPSIVLVTGGAKDNVESEWQAVATACGATILEYVPHFDEIGTLPPSMRASYVAEIGRMSARPVEVALAVDAGGEDHALPWFTLARGDVHDLKNGVVLNAIEGAQLLTWLDEKHLAGLVRRQWIIHRLEQIRARWQAALNTCEIESNKANLEAKAKFNEKAEALVSLLRRFRAGDDLRKVSAAALAVYDAIEAGLHVY